LCASKNNYDLKIQGDLITFAVTQNDGWVKFCKFFMNENWSKSLFHAFLISILNYMLPVFAS
jgi:hypothetical protein